MKKVLCFGEALIDFLNVGAAHQGPLTLPEFRQYPGGAPANAAVAVAQLGGQALFAGQVGQDPFGDFLADALSQYGVDTRFLLQHPHAKTALAFVMLDNSGDRSFSFHRHQTADVILDKQQVNPEWFSGETIVHICSNTLTTDQIAESTQHVVESARQAGNLISFDVNLRHNLWAENQADRLLVNKLVEQADLVKFSRDELDYLAEGETSAYLARCLNAQCQLLLVTDGANRIDYYTASHQGSIQPPSVKAVDTTAGGDAFIGGFLYGLSCLPNSHKIFVQPAELESLLLFASHCGAYAVTKPGAFPALPDLNNIQAQLRAHGHELSAFNPALFRSQV
ncbi:carbohydrate kinase family protein [Bowmanella yangjiangensis]|uniref:Carbohydrate kinase n=1 Tax=Bowmanella yangjiangensis TaxID=2811230 RepID=A0ABS3CT13_9ALTE|nr:carbohydrate kinase [Bowmanella yangjiangensis]MBN7820263.1 carbohydrate kinase [Bowmanella yangjiangensis]